MVTHKTKSKRTFHFRWFSLGACLLTIVGLLSLTGFMLVHWTERQILTTDNWVAVVSPVPQDEEVATALSDYAVTSVSNSINLEAKINQALPDRAAFLAPTLTDQLENRLKTRTKTFIQGDEFASLWQNANRLASQKILERARSDEPATPAPARFNIDLASFKTKVEALLDASGKTSDLTTSSKPDPDINIGVNLKASLQRLKSYIRAVDFLNGTLGLFALVSLLGALVMSRHRRRLFITICLSVVVICLVQLISAKALRPAILNQIGNSAYKPAVGVVYDTLLASFKQTASVVALVSVMLAIGAYLSQPRLRRSSIDKYTARLKKKAFWKWCTNARVVIGHYLPYIMAAAALLWLILLAFVADIDWQGIIRAGLFYILFFEVCKLVATKPGEVPMKQVKK